MRVAVTGGAGFLGRDVVTRAIADGHDVTVVDRAEQPAALPAEVEYRRADVRDRDALHDALDGAGAIVHAAFAPPYWPEPDMRAVNVDALTHVMTAAAELDASVVLVSSTIVERAPRPRPLLRHSGVARLEAYRATRIEAEAVASQWADRVRVAIARPKTFVGPGQVGAFALVFSLVRDGAVVPLLGDGRNRYQLVDVRDLADGIVRLAATDTARGVYHFGAAEFSTVGDDLAALIAAAGTSARVVHVPRHVAGVAVGAIDRVGIAPLSEWHHMNATGRDSIVDIGRARADLGWEPAHSNSAALVDAYRSYTADRVRTTHPVPWSHRALAGVARALSWRGR